MKHIYSIQYGFYPLSFSPKEEMFCSFPPGGRLGWGFNMNKE
jgi:hypothetical protein